MQRKISCNLSYASPPVVLQHELWIYSIVTEEVAT